MFIVASLGLCVNILVVVVIMAIRMVAMTMGTLTVVKAAILTFEQLLFTPSVTLFSLSVLW